MTIRHSNNRAPADDRPTVSEHQRRQWRAWCLDVLSGGSYGVVPVSAFVDAIVDHEVDPIHRSTVRAVLTNCILPSLNCEPGVEYDVDRQLVVRYGSSSR